MTQPWKHPNGIYYIRRRIPDDLKPILGKGDFYKVSLQTRIPIEAKTRHAAEWVKSEQLFERARAQLSLSPMLPAGDTVQMAARWAKHELAEMAKTGNFKYWLAQHGDQMETLGSFYGAGLSVQAFLTEPAVMRRIQADIACSVPSFRCPRS